MSGRQHAQVYGSAEASILEAQRQLEHQLQQPPERLRETLRDAKDALPALPEPPEALRHVLDSITGAALGQFGAPQGPLNHAWQGTVPAVVLTVSRPMATSLNPLPLCTVMTYKRGLPIVRDICTDPSNFFNSGHTAQPAVDSVQQSVQRQVASTIDISAAELTAGNAALGAMVLQLERMAGVQLGPEEACEQPCMDLGQYAALHSRACVCMRRSLLRLQGLAQQAGRESATATAGTLLAPA